MIIIFCFAFVFSLSGKLTKLVCVCAFRVTGGGRMLRLHPLWSPLQKALVVCTLIPRTDFLIDTAPPQTVDKSQNYKTTDWPIRDTDINSCRNIFMELSSIQIYGTINSTVCFGSRTFLSRHIGPLQFLLTISPPVILNQYVLFLSFEVYTLKVFFSLPKIVRYVDYCSQPISIVLNVRCSERLEHTVCPLKCI